MAGARPIGTRTKPACDCRQEWPTRSRSARRSGTPLSVRRGGDRAPRAQVHHLQRGWVMMSRVRTVTLIEAPTSAGAYAPGQEDGAGALLTAGLAERLEESGVVVRRGGRATPFRWRPDPGNPTAANADAVIDRAGQVAALTRSAPAGDTIVVLGGDCTVGVGTVAGLRQRVERPGVVYVDRHA